MARSIPTKFRKHHCGPSGREFWGWVAPNGPLALHATPHNRPPSRTKDRFAIGVLTGYPKLRPRRLTALRDLLGDCMRATPTKPERSNQTMRSKQTTLR